VWRERLGLLVLALISSVPLVVWPAATEPFHEPKRWLFAAAVSLAAVVTLPRWKWTAFPLIALATLQPTIEWVAFSWALAVFPALPLTRKRWMTALIWVGLAISVVVLLQRLGLDPLRTFGPQRLTERLAIYGTLGNPDFVASILLPLGVLSLSGRWWQTLIISLALALTGSLAVVSSALIAMLAAPRAGKWWWLLLIIAPLFTRDVGQTIRGRAYLVKVAAPHLLDAPLLGSGPVVNGWPEWELTFWQARCADAACVAASPDGRFVGRQDHVHADWLEVPLAHGLLGLCALLLALAAPLHAARKTSPLFFAALVAALSRGLVDFPLERPADLCLLAALCCLPFLPEPPCTAPSPSL
jgi:hypothetical protein